MYLNFNENIGIGLVYYCFGMLCYFLFKFIDLFIRRDEKQNELLDERDPRKEDLYFRT